MEINIVRSAVSVCYRHMLGFSVQTCDLPNYSALQQYNHDVCLFLQAKNKVGQAKSSVANATNKVEAALRDVQDIMKELGDLTAVGK